MTKNKQAKLITFHAQKEKKTVFQAMCLRCEILLTLREINASFVMQPYV
jgi:hypothetical protein